MIKKNNGKIRYKAILVAKRYQQKSGIDYTKIFFHIIKLTIIKLILKKIIAKNLYLEQINVMTAFFYGCIDNNIYMLQSKATKFLIKIFLSIN